MKYNKGLVLYTLYRNLFYDPCIFAKANNLEAFNDEDYIRIVLNVNRSLKQTEENMTGYDEYSSSFDLDESTLSFIRNEDAIAYKNKMINTITSKIKMSSSSNHFYDGVKENFVGLPEGYMKKFNYCNDDLLEDVVKSIKPVASILIAYLNDIGVDIRDSFNFRLYYFYTVLNKFMNHEMFDGENYLNKNILYSKMCHHIDDHIYSDSFAKIREIYKEHVKISFENDFNERKELCYDNLFDINSELEIVDKYIEMVIRLSLTNVNDESEMRLIAQFMDIFRESIGFKPIEEESNNINTY